MRRWYRNHLQKCTRGGIIWPRAVSIFSVFREHLRCIVVVALRYWITFLSKYWTCWLKQTGVPETIRQPPLVKAQNCVKKTKKNMAKNDFKYGGWNSYTLQCNTWLWDDMPLNSPKRLSYWNSTSGFDFDHITAVDMPFCTSLKFYQNRTTLGRKKWRYVDFQDGGSWILKGPIMGSLKAHVRLLIGRQ